MKEKWKMMYELAKQYYQEHGNLLVPARYICEDGTKLGQWISNQRVAYKNRTIPKEERNNNSSPLTNEQIKLLEEIGMVWSVGTGQFNRKKNHVKWMENYGKAVEYYHQYGNLLVLVRYICEDGTKLGQWISNQRVAYKNRTIPKEEQNNNFSPLTDEQVQLLEKIDMVWSVEKGQFDRKKIQLKWMKNYEKAVEYYHQYGNLLVSVSYICEDGTKLGQWISIQRKAYKNRTIPKEKRNNNFSPLTDKQVKSLEEIGMVWSVEKVEIIRLKWMENYEKAEEYYRHHGNLLVPARYICEDRTQLGQWISVQRRAYKNRMLPKEERNNSFSPLTDEQVKLLEKVGMVWQISKMSLKTKIEHQWSKSLKKAENEILTKKYSSKTTEWLTEQFQLQEQNKLTKNQLTMLKNTGVYSTPAYQIYFKQAFLDVFKNVIYYFRDHKMLLEPTDITRLGWTYEEWYEIFNKNELGILDEKQYEVWRKVWFISKQKNKVFKIK